MGAASVDAETDEAPTSQATDESEEAIEVDTIEAIDIEKEAIEA